MSDVPQGKTYSLTHQEAQLIKMVQGHTNAIMSMLVTHIASSRLGYPVTDRTNFNLTDDFKSLTIQEMPTMPRTPGPSESGAVQQA